MKGDAGDVLGRLCQRAAHGGLDPGGRGAHLPDRHFERRRHTVESPCESHQRTIATGANAVDDASHPPFERCAALQTRPQEPIERCGVT